MTDIVERLRAYHSRIMNDAADEIERLNRDVMNLEGYLATQRDEIEMLRDEIKRLCRIPVRSADEHINTVMERNIRKAMQEPDPEGTP